MTDLDIQGGIDKSDHDRIVVEPHPWMDNVLEAIENLGFHFNEADCEQAPYFQRRLPSFKSLNLFQRQSITVRC